MSDVTDWLSAAGGIVGAIGGPAGIWAAWSQHRENRRQREAEPEELVTLLGKVKGFAREVANGYKDNEWFQTCGAEDVIKRFEELIHLVRDRDLRSDLGDVPYLYSNMRFSLTYPYQADEERYSAVLRQAQQAELLQIKAGELLEVMRERR